MAHPQETRDKLRKAFVFDQLSLEIAALQAGIGFGTARRWKADAKANGDVAVGTRAVPAPGDRNCLQDTGSLIPPAKGQCLPVSGRSYSSTDIQRTGQTDIGQALQQLDPSVTLGH